jgi:ABC-2 type transport system ATP-binding protein
VAEGSPNNLKKRIGGESIIVGVENDKDLEKARELMESQKYVSKLYANEAKLHLYVKDGEQLIATVLRLLDQHKIPVKTIELSKPSLDDVFLQHTGRSLREGGS